jgi:hypothetical protein
MNAFSETYTVAALALAASWVPAGPSGIQSGW